MIMLKKISWIVALLAALTIVFMGCTNLGVDPDAEVEDVERLDLGDPGTPGFNTVAGQPAQQKGWATDGYTDVDNPEAAAEGYKLADFKKAKYLVIETAQNAKGGLQFVWQSANFPDDGWKTQKFDALASSSGANPGVTKEANKLGGQTIKIDIKKVLGPTYSNFLEASGNVRFIIAYYSSNLADLDVKDAYLLVSKEAQSGGTELPGLGEGLGQLGQTTVRKSSTAYGWTFAVKDSKGNLPKGTEKNPIKFKDVALLRDPVRDMGATTPVLGDPFYLVLVTESGGVGINGEVSWFNEVKITFEATGKLVDRKAQTTSLWGPTLEYKAGGQVVFVIDLRAIPGYDDIVTEQKFSPAEETEDKKLGDKAKGIKQGDIKYYTVNLILETDFTEFGLKRAYLIRDTGNVLVKSGVPANWDTEDLESEFLGQTVGVTNSYVTKYDVTLPFIYEAPVEIALADCYQQSSGNKPYNGDGGGFIKDSQLTLLEDAAKGSFFRAHVRNNASSNRNNWGIGAIGGKSISAPANFPAGGESFIDVNISDMDLVNNGDGVYLNIWGSCVFTKFEIYEPK
jgi:hypothetical protein